MNLRAYLHFIYMSRFYFLYLIKVSAGQFAHLVTAVLFYEKHYLIS